MAQEQSDEGKLQIYVIQSNVGVVVGGERERCLQDDKIFTVFPWDFPQIFFWSQIIKAFKVI